MKPNATEEKAHRSKVSVLAAAKNVLAAIIN